MADFPIIPVDVFRGTACNSVWNTLVTHYQGRPGVTITQNEITEAANGSVIQYIHDDAAQTITWQIKTNGA